MMRWHHLPVRVIRRNKTTVTGNTPHSPTGRTHSLRFLFLRPARAAPLDSTRLDSTRATHASVGGRKSRRVYALHVLSSLLRCASSTARATSDEAHGARPQRAQGRDGSARRSSSWVKSSGATLNVGEHLGAPMNIW